MQAFITVNSQKNLLSSNKQYGKLSLDFLTLK